MKIAKRKGPPNKRRTPEKSPTIKHQKSKQKGKSSNRFVSLLKRTFTKKKKEDVVCTSSLPSQQRVLHSPVTAAVTDDEDENKSNLEQNSIPSPAHENEETHFSSPLQPQTTIVSVFLISFFKRRFYKSAFYMKKI